MSDTSDVLVPKDHKRPQGATSSVPDPMKGGDVYRWSMEQAALIREGRYDEIDWVNVADEIESVGKSEFRAIKSRVEVIIVHMLKWDHQSAKRSRSWIKSIEESRDRLLEDLSDNPSLGTRKDEAIDTGYRLGRRVAARQTDLDLKTFPASCPYDWDAIMTRPFVLDQTGETA